MSDNRPTLLTSDANPAFLRDSVGPLVVQPVITGAVATQVSTVVHIDERANRFRVPLVVTDPVAAWTGEGDTITETVGS